MGGIPLAIPLGAAGFGANVFSPLTAVTQGANRGGKEIMRRLSLMLPIVALCLATGAFAQTTGAIEGKVTDAQGLVLPGVSVTLSGEAVLGAQTAVTVADGTYRFRALRPASYNLAFELAGFQSLNREGIVVSGARTITVDASLSVATVAETITVTGESPVVDVRNTALSKEFTVEELKDVPRATDMCAVSILT